MDTNVTLDVGKNVTDLLEKLAQTLGLTVEKIYPYYIKQILIEGYTDVILLTIGLIAGIISFSVGLKKGLSLNKNNDTRFDGDAREALVPTLMSVVGGIVLLVSLLVFFFSTSNLVSQISNPEYHAIQRIIEDASKLKP